MIAHNASLSPGQASGDYYPQLDAMRALAISIVAFQHWMHPIASALGIHGSYGVWLFFTLSGYLITGILLRYRDSVLSGAVTRADALKVFFMRRFLRILPAYYMFLFIAFLMGRLTAENGPWHLLYLSNIYFMQLGEFETMGHLWSLSVEEQFYLAWPALVLALAHGRLVAAIAAGIAVALLFRTASVADGWGLAHYVFPLAALDTLGLGGLLAWLQVSDAPRLRQGLRLAQWPALVLLPFIGFAPEAVFQIFAPLIVGLAGTFIIQKCVAGITGLPGRVFTLPTILYIGRISYGLYLYHALAAWIVPEGILSGTLDGYYEQMLAVAALRALACVAIASLSWQLMEQPLNRLKRYWTLDGRPPAGSNMQGA